MQNTIPKHVKHQERAQERLRKVEKRLSTTPLLEPQVLKTQGIGVTKRRAIQEKKSALVTNQKNIPNTTKTQPAHTEVSTSTMSQNIDQLFDKAILLIMSKRVEKGQGNKEDLNQTNIFDLKVIKKPEIVSASKNENVQARLSQAVYNHPMTVTMHLPSSKSVETDAGPKEEQLDTFVSSPCQEEQCQRLDQEKETQLESSSPLVEPQGKHTKSKSSNTLKTLEVICYRCQNRAHYAKECPTKNLAIITSLEPKKNNLKECDNLVESDLTFLSSSIIHLSLPKDVKTALGVMSEQADQKESLAHDVNQKEAQDTTHFMLPMET